MLNGEESFYDYNPLKSLTGGPKSTRTTDLPVISGVL